MTLPYEQYISMVNTRNFLLSLCDPSRPDYVKKIPSAVRKNAIRLLKHFPMEYDANNIISDHVEISHMRCMDPSMGQDVIYYSARHLGWVWNHSSGKVMGPFFDKRTAMDSYRKSQTEAQDALCEDGDSMGGSGWVPADGL